MKKPLVKKVSPTPAKKQAAKKKRLAKSAVSDDLGEGKAEVSPENSGETRNPSWFKPGQSGNPAGKPKGARHKLGEAFLLALHEDFQAHGVQAIETVRTEKPDAYLKTIAMILPKELNIKVDPFDELTDSELDSVIKQLSAALSLEMRAGESAEGEARKTQVQQAKPVRPLH